MERKASSRQCSWSCPLRDRSHQSWTLGWWSWYRSLPPSFTCGSNTSGGNLDWCRRATSCLPSANLIHRSLTPPHQGPRHRGARTAGWSCPSAERNCTVSTLWILPYRPLFSHCLATKIAKRWIIASRCCWNLPAMRNDLVYFCCLYCRSSHLCSSHSLLRPISAKCGMNHHSRSGYCSLCATSPEVVSGCRQILLLSHAGSQHASSCVATAPAVYSTREFTLEDSWLLVIDASPCSGDLCWSAR